MTTLHQQPEIHWKLDPDGDDTFADLDRFNRVTSSRWTVDLATDVDFYSVDISYDRGSNITRIEDNVHTGFDASYTMDDVDRLTRTQEGTWNGSSITSETRDQEWTLSHTGNWDVAKWDLDGDGDWGDADEYEDTRTHNAVNELEARDMDSDSTDDYTHAYDPVGNMTDDGESYKYEWDPFGRLRKVRNQSDDLVAEYRYNGMGFQVSEHADTDDDGDVDGSDLWFHSAFDERWRKLATFRESDSDPKEEFIPHQAGLSGRGGSSYINLVVCRDRDANTAWTAASDGVLEEKMFYSQNWRGDVSAIVRSTGILYEWAKYSSYGVPFGLPGGDTDSDGDCDATDVTQIQTWINASSYDVRGDIDLDGDVDADDKSVVQSFFQGKTARWKVLSTIGNLMGYAGYSFSRAGHWHVRHRVLDPRVGNWLRRDPLGYADSHNLYEYVRSNAVALVDPSGLAHDPVALEDCHKENDKALAQCMAINPPRTWSMCIWAHNWFKEKCDELHGHPPDPGPKQPIQPPQKAPLGKLDKMKNCFNGCLGDWTFGTTAGVLLCAVGSSSGCLAIATIATVPCIKVVIPACLKAGGYTEAIGASACLINCVLTHL